MPGTKDQPSEDEPKQDEPKQDAKVVYDPINKSSTWARLQTSHQRQALPHEPLKISPRGKRDSLDATMTEAAIVKLETKWTNVIEQWGGVFGEKAKKLLANACKDAIKLLDELEDAGKLIKAHKNLTDCIECLEKINALRSPMDALLKSSPASPLNNEYKTLLDRTCEEAIKQFVSYKNGNISKADFDNACKNIEICCASSEKLIDINKKFNALIIYGDSLFAKIPTDLMKTSELREMLERTYQMPPNNVADLPMCLEHNKADYERLSHYVGAVANIINLRNEGIEALNTSSPKYENNKKSLDRVVSSALEALTSSEDPKYSDHYLQAFKNLEVHVRGEESPQSTRSMRR